MLQDSAEIVESDTFSSTRTFPSSHRLGVDVFDVVEFSKRSVDAAEAEGVIVIAVAIFVGSKGDEVLKGIGEIVAVVSSVSSKVIVVLSFSAGSNNAEELKGVK